MLLPRRDGGRPAGRLHADQPPATEPGVHCEPVDPDPHAPLYLRKHDFLLLEEVIGPRTGLAADADPARKHVVVLTDVRPRFDPVANRHYVEVAWGPATPCRSTSACRLWCPTRTRATATGR